MPQQKRHLIHLVSSNRWAGAQQYACDICRHYMEAGWEVTAVTRDARVVDSHFQEAGVEVRHAPLRGFFDPASAWMLASLLRKIPQGQGVIHVHRYRDAFTALLAKRIAKRKDILVVVTRHSIRSARKSALFRRIYRKINAHIFVSDAARLCFLSTWPQHKDCPIAPERIHVLHNSIPAVPAEATPEPSRGPIFAICHGPLAKGKGIESAIDALQFLTDLKLRLRIAGPGNPDYLDLLRRRAITLGVMEAIDWDIGPDVPDSLILSAHFAIHPSLHREAGGIDNIRDMACARPQICTASGAQTEYLRDGVSAIIVPPANPGAIAQAMRALASDPELRQQMGTAAFADFHQLLDWNVFTSRLSKIYHPD